MDHSEEVKSMFTSYFPDIVALTQRYTGPGLNRGLFQVDELSFELKRRSLIDSDIDMTYKDLMDKCVAQSNLHNSKPKIYGVQLRFDFKIEDEVNPETKRIYRVDILQEVLEKRAIIQDDGFDIFSIRIYPTTVFFYVYKVSELPFLLEFDKTRWITLNGVKITKFNFNEHLQIVLQATYGRFDGRDLLYRTVSLLQSGYDRWTYYTFEGPSKHTDIQDVFDWFDSGGKLQDPNYKIEEARKLKKSDIDMLDIQHIFNILSDYGFEFNITTHLKDETKSRYPAPRESGILNYCNGYVRVRCRILIGFFIKKPAGMKIIEDINLLLEEVSDRISDIDYTSYNEIYSRVIEGGQREILVDYYLFKENAFKRGTKFGIPDPEFLIYKNGCILSNNLSRYR